MASFTSNPDLPVSQYIPEVDPGLYAGVLGQKRQQYEIGLQRVNALVDQVNGLTVTRDVEKNYLKALQGSMQAELESLANADFSKPEVVNKAKQIASKVAADPYVQKYVTSAQKIQRFEASRREKEAKGEYAPEARYYDDLFLNDFLTSTDPEKSYTGPEIASTFHDYTKELNAVLKELDPQVTYTLLPNGELDYTAIEESSLSPETIMNTVANFFATNPKYRQSMQMSALYNSAHIRDKEQLLQLDLESFNSVYKSYDDRINQLYKQIADNPNNPQLHQQAKAMIAELKKAQDVESSNFAKYVERVNNPETSLESLKVDRFLDVLKRDAVIRYQSFYQKVEEKESLVGKRFLDYVKAGLDPVTRAPLSPNSPYWTTYKRAKGDEEEEDSDIPIPKGANEGATPWNMDKVRTEIEKTRNQILDTDQKLMEMYKRDYPTATLEDYERYKATQEKNLQEGKVVDTNYLTYRKKTEASRLYADVLEEELKTITEDAASRYSIDKIQPYKANLKKLRKADGGSTGELFMEIDPSDPAHQEFLYRVQQLNERYAELVSEISAGMTVFDKRLVKDRAARALAEEDNEFSKHLRYVQADLKRSGSDVLDDFIKNILGPVEGLLTERMRYEDSKARDLQTRTTYMARAFKGNKEELDQYRRIIVEALSSQVADDPNSDKVPDMDKIKPMSSLQAGNGVEVIRYQIDGQPGIKEVELSTKGDYFPNSDNYFWLKSAVDLHGRTPSGQNALTTSNGKIRYVIERNEITGSYTGYILTNDDTKIPIRKKYITGVATDDTPAEASHPKELYEAFEQLSLSKIATNRETLFEYLLAESN